MTKSQPNWKLLPTEILQEVFCLAPEKELHNIALVCKAWLYPAQLILYNSVTISRFSHLENFYGIVKSNAHLGYTVKKFHIGCISVSKRGIRGDKKTVLAYINDLLSTYLPTLYELTIAIQWSYAPALNALKNSHLGRLKRLNAPSSLLMKSEAINYIKCVLLMKDRLEDISITDDFDFVEESERQLYNRLYNELDQFDKLQEISIKKKVDNGIQVLEYIVESCKSIQKLNFDFRYPDRSEVSPNNNTSAEMISGFNPRTNIKSITGFTNSYYDEKTLMYIMRKFPHPDTLILDTLRNYQCSFIGNINSYNLSDDIILQLLYYCSTIDCCVSGLIVHENDVNGIYYKFWESTSCFGSENVEFVYSNNVSLTTMDISKTNCSNRLFKLISGIHSWSDWISYDPFIEMNGMFIRSMTFTFISEYMVDDRWVIGGEFLLPEMGEIFNFCPNLQYLKYNYCAIFAHNYSYPDLSKKIALSELTFEDCVLYNGAIENFSTYLSEIKQLNLSRLKDDTYLAYDDGFLSCSKIIMSHTKIHSISFKLPVEKELYIKTFVNSDDKYYYDRYDDSLGSIERSSEKEYMDAEVYKRIYICCKTKPNLEIYGLHCQ